MDLPNKNGDDKGNEQQAKVRTAGNVILLQVNIFV
jgi:hypothetical protein